MTIGTTNHSWLGREFLTWIWFRVEVEGGSFDLASGSLDLIIEDNLVMVGHDDEASVSSIKGGCPTLRPEAASALAGGMMIRRAKMHAARDERTWTFNFDAETLDLKSIKVPASEAEDPLEQLSERLGAAEELRDAVEELFSQFLELRLQEDWDSIEAPRMRDWVRAKLDRAEADQKKFHSEKGAASAAKARSKPEVAKKVAAPVKALGAEGLDDEDLSD